MQCACASRNFCVPINTCSSVLHPLLQLFAPRLISRAVLFYFKEVCPHTSEEQDKYDVMLDEAMIAAPAAVGERVALGKVILEGKEEFVKTILPQVQSTLPEAINCVQCSYSLAIFTTLKVCYTLTLFAMFSKQILVPFHTNAYLSFMFPFYSFFRELTSERRSMRVHYGAT